MSCVAVCILLPVDSSDAQLPCLSAPITVARARGTIREVTRLSLTLCDGRPNYGALNALSIVARARDVERPRRNILIGFMRTSSAATLRDYVAPGLRRLHAGLLVRVQAIANHFPGRPVHIVSGHRPTARQGSRHRIGRAVDIRIAGVHRRVVAGVARRFPATGVGFYPNSTFTHIDVRHRHAFWTDWSGPGEEPDYGDYPTRGHAQGSVSSDRYIMIR